MERKSKKTIKSHRNLSTEKYFKNQDPGKKRFLSNFSKRSTLNQNSQINGALFNSKYNEKLAIEAKKIKKSTSKEQIIQTNIKKCNSIEKDLNLVEGSKNEATIQNKKVLTSQMKRDFEKNIIKEEKYDEHRLTYFFRSRLYSLIKILGFSQFIYNQTKNINKLRATTHSKKQVFYYFF